VNERVKLSTKISEGGLPLLSVYVNTIGEHHDYEPAFRLYPDARSSLSGMPVGIGAVQRTDRRTFVLKKETEGTPSVRNGGQSGAHQFDLICREQSDAVSLTPLFKEGQKLRDARSGGE
jgi:hypothetical protein